MFWFLMSAAIAEEPTAEPHFVSTFHHQGLILTPEDTEWIRIHKGTVERPLEIEVGQRSATVRPIQIHTIDGVSVGSQWQVADQGQQCTVDGFAVVEMDARTHHRPASPCGEPLILATFDCSAPLLETRQPTLAIPLQEAAPVVGEAQLPTPFDASSPHYKALQADPTHAALTADQTRMLLPPTLTAWRLGDQEVAVVEEGSLSTTLRSVLVDGAVQFVSEGNVTAALDTNQDGTPELLGWSGQVSGAGEDLYSWQLLRADGAVQMSAVINWCEGD